MKKNSFGCNCNFHATEEIHLYKTKARKNNIVKMKRKQIGYTRKYSYFLTIIHTRKDTETFFS